MTDTVEKIPLAARVGQWMFPRRVLIPLPLIILALLVFLYTALVPAEERFLREKFGDQYEAYCRAVPRLAPRMRPWRSRHEGGFDWVVLRGEAWIVGYLVVIYSAMLAVERFRS